MSTASDRRSRKRLATRQTISDAATQLFIERGYDHVTVDEIARLADVGRMTVFNHFPRKEDMFFDLDEMGRADLVEALDQAEFQAAPIEALRLFAHRIVRERKPYVRLFPESRRFFEAIEASETLKARARAIRDELTYLVATAFARSVGRPPDDPEARLASSLLVATWGLAFVEAHRAYQSGQDERRAHAVLLEMIDRGAAGTTAALAGTPYVGASCERQGIGLRSR